MENLIDIRNLMKSYGAARVLDGIDLTVSQGEIIALLGENGAGKSTLINLINGLARADSGELTVGLPQRKIGVMLQSNLLLARVTVREALELARSYYREPLASSELLRLSDLTLHEKSLMTALSGGQKRRLSFALALAGDPELIFLDEPTTGMDAVHRRSFWLEITRLSAAGKTFFITSHYLEELENLASRLVLLADHKVKFDGTLSELRAQQAASEVSFNFDGELPVSQLTAVKTVTQTGNFYRLSTDNANALVSSLQPLLSQGLSNLTVQQNSLDNLFSTILKEDN